MVASVAEVTGVASGTNRLVMTLDDDSETLRIMTPAGSTCHIVTYSSSSISSRIRKTLISFNQPVEVAAFYRQASGLCAVVATRDGRFWHGSLHSLKKGLLPHDAIFTEFHLDQPLLNVKLLTVCQDCVDGVALAVAGSGQTPPHVVWFDNDASEEDTTTTTTVPGLEHVHSPIKCMLFPSRDNVSPAFWTLLTRTPSCEAQSVECILLLGFEDGAIRFSLITASKQILPVHLLARIDGRQEASVISILGLTSGDSNLIDRLCFVGCNGSVFTLDNTGSLRRDAGGLRLSGPWTSAVLVDLTDKKGILATRHNGTSHLLVLPEEEAGRRESICALLPVREDMATVSSCMSPQGSFFAFRTFDGSIVLMQVDSNGLEKILAFGQDGTLFFGVLSAVVEQQHKTASASTASRTRRVLQCLRQYDRWDLDASAHDESAQLDANQRAINTTSFFLNNVRDGRNRDSNVSISDETGVATAHSRSLKGLVPASASSGGAWTRSLHACFRGEDDAVSGKAAAVCQRSIDGNESGELSNVVYGGVAVTENRVLVDGADQTMETKMNDAKPVDAFLSITDTARESSSDKGSVRVHSKRRKTSSSVAPPTSCSTSSSVEPLVIPL